MNMHVRMGIIHCFFIIFYNMTVPIVGKKREIMRKPMKTADSVGQKFIIRR